MDHAKKKKEQLQRTGKARPVPHCFARQLSLTTNTTPYTTHTPSVLDAKKPI